VVRPLKIIILSPGTFTSYQKSLGKLGRQNKVARLSNDLTIMTRLINEFYMYD